MKRCALMPPSADFCRGGPSQAAVACKRPAAAPPLYCRFAMLSEDGTLTGGWLAGPSSMFEELVEHRRWNDLSSPYSPTSKKPPIARTKGDEAEATASRNSLRKKSSSFPPSLLWPLRERDETSENDSDPRSLLLDVYSAYGARTHTWSLTGRRLHTSNATGS